VHSKTDLPLNLEAERGVEVPKGKEKKRVSKCINDGVTSKKSEEEERSGGSGEKALQFQD